MNRFLLFILASMAVLCLSPIGCKCRGKKEKDPQAVHKAYINEQIALANKHLEAQETDNAISVLENLSHRFHYDPTVWEVLGVAYSTAKKNALAAATFERVAYMGVEFQENALYAAQAYRDIGDGVSASRCYRFYLDGFPKDSNAWKELSSVERTLGHTFLALQSYLKSLDVTQKNLSERDALTLGELFLEVKNFPQADFWLNYAVEKNPDSLEAHLGLLRLNYEQKLWVEVAKTLAIVDKLDAEAVKKASLEFVRNDLASHLVLVEESDVQKSPLLEPMVEEKTSDTENTNDQEVVKEIDSEKSLLSEPVVEEKISDVENTNNQEVLGRYDSNFWLKKPQFNVGGLRDFANSGNETGASEAPPQDLSSAKPETATEIPDTPYGRLLKQGHEALLKGNSKEAAKAYQSAIAQNIKPAEAWYALSQAFFVGKEWFKAELAILEAQEREPKNFAFELHFLRIAQKKYSSTQFMELLKKAREKFPNNPRIFLILGRAYEKIEPNRAHAIQAYRRFLELVPDTHHKRAEAQSSLARLMR